LYYPRLYAIVQLLIFKISFSYFKNKAYSGCLGKEIISVFPIDRSQPPVYQRGHVKGVFSKLMNQSIKTPFYLDELAKDLRNNIKGIVIELIKIKLSE